MSTVLIVEDSRSLRALFMRRLAEAVPARIVAVGSLAEARRCMDGSVTLVLAGLVLGDAPDGEAVAEALARGLPTLVMTGSEDEALRARLLAQGALDVVQKDRLSSLDSVVSEVRRTVRNAHTKVLVVDDARTIRRSLRRVLESRQLRVIEARDGVEAVEQLRAHPDVRLVLTDHEMPRMGGLALVDEIRRHHDRHERGVIGLSGGASGDLATAFLRHGANDFLNKPFRVEELVCRVEQNLDLVDAFRQLRDVATRDFLTRMRNRRYFFQAGPGVLRHAGPAAVAMLDIDLFKKVNDTWGHEAGDLVLRQVAHVRSRHLPEPTSLVARLGGEEFAFVLPARTAEEARARCDEIRPDIDQQRIETDSGALRVTASTGVVFRSDGTLEQRINRADSLLYEAKRGGRNRVVLSGDALAAK